MGKIRTYTGRLVDPLDLRPEDINIRDIAHSLSQINRFGGHSAWPYTVCQHSIYVANEIDSNPRVELIGLLHDASEAYLGDIPRPLKYAPQFLFYREAEDRAMAVIYQAMGCDAGVVEFNWPLIKKADNAVLVAEGLVLMNERYEGFGEPADIVIRSMAAVEVEDWFLATYGRLMRETKWGIRF